MFCEDFLIKKKDKELHQCLWDMAEPRANI